jgi:hypothetical protein
MSDEAKTLQADIAFVRAPVEESGSAMARDGAVLAVAGVVFSLTTLQYWLVSADIVVVSPRWAGWLWVDGAVVFFVAMALIQRRIPSQSGAVSRAMRAAWAGAGTGSQLPGRHSVWGSVGDSDGCAVITYPSRSFRRHRPRGYARVLSERRQPSPRS